MQDLKLIFSLIMYDFDICYLQQVQIRKLLKICQIADDGKKTEKENFKNRRSYLRYSTKREESRRFEKRDLLSIDDTNMQIVVVVVAIKPLQ